MIWSQESHPFQLRIINRPKHAMRSQGLPTYHFCLHRPKYILHFVQMYTHSSEDYPQAIDYHVYKCTQSMHLHPQNTILSVSRPSWGHSTSFHYGKSAKHLNLWWSNKITIAASSHIGLSKIVLQFDRHLNGACQIGARSVQFCYALIISFIYEFYIRYLICSVRQTMSAANAGTLCIMHRHIPVLTINW